MPFYLERNEALPDGLRRIAREQIGKALDEIEDPDLPLRHKVHSLRKRCKKMRGLLRLGRPLMCEAFEAEDDRFREVGKLLAEYRDTHVFRATIESLGGTCGDDGDPQAPVSTVALERSAGILSEALEAVPCWPLDLHGFVDIGPGFARTYRRCCLAWAEVLREPSDRNFHQLRKWTKYHWYQVRIIERINKRQLRERRMHLRELHLVLGEAHDIYAMEAASASLPGLDKKLLKKADTRKLELYRDAIVIGRKIFSPAVDDLVARCARWWADWKR